MVVPEEVEANCRGIYPITACREHADQKQLGLRHGGMRAGTLRFAQMATICGYG